MEYCEFCEEDVSGNILHCELYTCMVNELNYLKQARINKEGDIEEQKYRNIRINQLKDLLKDDFECMFTEKKFNTLNEILDHERTSWGCKVIQRETSVYMSVFCPDCGKEFIDRGQKMQVKYLLNRHMKKCAINKERYLRLELEKLVTTLSSEKMVEVIRFIKET
jgi:predicted RNA-binding Zn-ribbon protein involved in translation (DUF1610 family)